MFQEPRDQELLAELVRQWHSTRKWAEQLLVDSLGLSKPEDVLQGPLRGHHKIPGSPWQYRTHGNGVEIFQDGNKGGIDFDFDEARPCTWRLREFLVKQLNAGQLRKADYRPLAMSSERWEEGCRQLGRRISR